jgi:protein-S-isoprenylcysteine O-methyltransferase Ste14
VRCSLPLCWAGLLVEFIEFLRVQESREGRAGATKTGLGGWWLAAGVCVIAANIWLHLAPPVIPAATIRPGAAAFTAGMVIFLAGVGLRGWSFRALGWYFTYGIVVSPGRPVTNGPYRMLRHPSYAGGLLIYTGIGAMSANWIGLAAMTLLPLAVIIWRIYLEEDALLATLGDRYRSYASHHKRLVPLGW